MAAMSTACQQRIALNDGRQMPSFGLGVWQAPLGACKAAVLHALRCGYRHIDTAEVYGNEQDVGDALAIFLKERPDVQREDVWVTTKFFPRNGASREAIRTWNVDGEQWGGTDEQPGVLVAHARRGLIDTFARGPEV